MWNYFNRKQSHFLKIELYQGISRKYLKTDIIIYPWTISSCSTCRTVFSEIDFLRLVFNSEVICDSVACFFFLQFERAWYYNFICYISHRLSTTIVSVCTCFDSFCLPRCYQWYSRSWYYHELSNLSQRYVKYTCTNNIFL